MSEYPPPPPPSRYPAQPYPGQPYAGQHYAAQPYPGQPHPGGGQPPAGPPPAPPTGGGPGRSDDAFRRRFARRPEPRFTVALAGAGAALALFGVFLWGGTYYGEGLAGSYDGTTNRNLLGGGLAALLVVVGYVLAIVQRRGSLATAGVVAVGVGVPLALGFLTLDVTSTDVVNLDAVFWVSLVVWAVSYAVVPGTRGHTFFVFLIASGLFEYVISKNTPRLNGGFFGGNGPQVSGTGTIAAIGLILGLGYYLIAFLLDRSGRHGPATGLVYPAFVATASGIVAWGRDIHLAGVGILTIVIGLLICWYGGHFGRRVTCFAAAGAVTLGVGLLVYDAAKNDGVKAGVSFLVVGFAVVVIAALFSRALGEPHDLDSEAVTGSR